MKRLNLITGIFFAAFLFFIGCSSDDGGTNPPPSNGTDYYPSSEGNYYNYQNVVTDTSGTQTAGERSTYYNGTQVFAGTTYRVQIDSIFVGGSLNTSTESYFRKTEGGVYFFLDTTGISEIIPDSILQYVSIDAELGFLSFPLDDGKNWDVFKMNLQYGGFSLTLVNVTANIQGTETIAINLNTGQVSKEAKKILYTFTLQIPDLENPLNVNQATFEATAWLVGDIGVAKWQGNGVILGAFGGEIDFDDTTKVVSQELISYKVN